MLEALSVILRGPGNLAVERAPVPRIPGPAVRVDMKACGICGSDIRYFHGENPWALHTLGYNKPCPPNMIIGHEVAGETRVNGEIKRVAILAYKACGVCECCQTGRENLCEDMQHFGHSAGWDEMPHYPGGMSETFEIWDGFAYAIPDSVSFEEATFLDGLAVVVHAVDMSDLRPGGRAAVIGLGPIGMLCAQAALAAGASSVAGCDTQELPIELAEKVGLAGMVHAGSAGFASHIKGRAGECRGFDAIFDTVGSSESIRDGLSLLNKSGSLVLLAVHETPMNASSAALSGERRILTSSNSPYGDFPRAIELMGSGKVKTAPLVTHRFPLSEAREAFDLMDHKAQQSAFKIILHP